MMITRQKSNIFPPAACSFLTLLVRTQIRYTLCCDPYMSLSIFCTLEVTGYITGLDPWMCFLGDWWQKFWSLITLVFHNYSQNFVCFGCGCILGWHAECHCCCGFCQVHSEELGLLVKVVNMVIDIAICLSLKACNIYWCIFLRYTIEQNIFFLSGMLLYLFENCTRTS